MLGSMSKCSNVVEVRRILRASSSLDEVYGTLFAQIRQATPWVFHLFYLLLLARDTEMGERAVLQYLACDEWEEGDLNDRVRTADEVIAACRGLVTTVMHPRVVDEGSEAGLVFQFCRWLFPRCFLIRRLHALDSLDLSVREYLDSIT